MGPDMTAETAEKLWEQILPFSGYGFNQGHATAYADVSYRSAYLKTHYPAEFLAARLQDWGGFHHPAIYMSEAVRLGIPVHPPHVNFSGRKFTLVASMRDGNGSSLAASGCQASSTWVSARCATCVTARPRPSPRSARRGAAYLDLRDLLSRVDLQPKEIDHLIRCGALDGLGDAPAGASCWRKPSCCAAAAASTSWHSTSRGRSRRPSPRRSAGSGSRSCSACR